MKGKGGLTIGVLKVSWSGERIRVIPERVTTTLRVPAANSETALGDESPGQAAAALFDASVEAGALVVPDGLVVQCYGDDDEEGGGFILGAFSTNTPRVGVTTGWRDVKNITCQPGCEGDSEVVLAALRFMAAEVNTALHG